jgi:hypothetical protein
VVRAVVVVVVVVADLAQLVGAGGNEAASQQASWSRLRRTEPASACGKTASTTTCSVAARNSAPNSVENGWNRASRASARNHDDVFGSSRTNDRRTRNVTFRAINAAAVVRTRRTRSRVDSARRCAACSGGRSRVRESFGSRYALISMESIWIIAFFVIYLALQIWILPRLGVRT